VSKPAVVVGAGLAGMNAAIQLQSAGREVVVLEAADRAGAVSYTHLTLPTKLL
jgi:monoamine oxidase